VQVIVIAHLYQPLPTNVIDDVVAEPVVGTVPLLKSKIAKALKTELLTNNILGRSAAFAYTLKVCATAVVVTDWSIRWLLVAVVSSTNLSPVKVPSGATIVLAVMLDRVLVQLALSNSSDLRNRLVLCSSISNPRLSPVTGLCSNLATPLAAVCRAGM
jgi:hypothetical protein